MTSHGIPRTFIKPEQSAESRQKELKDIEAYKALIDQVNKGIEAGDYSPSMLQKTADLLKKNPEYYTIWNHRRRIYAHEFDFLIEAVKLDDLEEEKRQSQVLDIIQLDLQFLFPLLLKFPKCYWIWNHRLWLLEKSSLLLSATTARRLWEEELGLVGKMLNRDSRNFHGWGYRRIVVENLESSTLNGSSMAKKEFDYTTKMVGMNLSNFSAWHNRSKLILRILNEESASDEERQKMLDEELKLIHQALFDPYDQSLWFYHQALMSTFDPDRATQTMAPNLTKEHRLEYISTERRFIDEVLEDAKDCKWIYQALIDCSLLQGKNEGSLSDESKREMKAHLSELKKLDPLRNGRWVDMEKGLEVETTLPRKQ